jgi:hypothetical protein
MGVKIKADQAASSLLFGDIWAFWALRQFPPESTIITLADSHTSEPFEPQDSPA